MKLRHKIQDKTLRRSYACAVAILGLLILVGATATVFGAAGGEGGVHGGSCAPSNYTGTYWDTCYGATWRYYSWPGNAEQVVIQGNSNVSGGTVYGCKEAGGYYRLALEKYHVSNGRPQYSLGSQYGLVPANKVYPYGSYSFNSSVSPYSMSEMETAFALAVQRGQNNGLSWPNVSWFCSNGDIEEPDDPDPEYSHGSGDAHFYAKSTVSVSAQNGDVSAHSQTTPNDGTTTIKISTDGSSFTANFSHTLYYVNDSSYASDDVFDDVSTSWSVSDSGASGTYSKNGKTNGNSRVATSSQTVSLNPGETKTLCSQISYNPKYITFYKEDIQKRVRDYWHQVSDYSGHWHYKWVHDYYHFQPNGSSGRETAKACVQVTRPADPTGPGASTNASTSSDIFYAGEDGTVGWQASGTGYGVRRITAQQGIVYQVPSYVGHYSGITSGSTRYRSGDVCTYYQGKSATSYCAAMVSDTWTGSGSRSINTTEGVVIPDEVGGKYCNAFGYKIEYWYAYNNGSGDSWHHDSSRDYWYIYDSDCRTIAKKPSTAIWNGSLQTNGGVKTSIAYRFDTATMGAKSSAGGNRTTYGSWSEFMNVVAGSVTGTASGATLALGSSSNDILANSPLTIANSGSTLGYSGVTSNSAFRTRLDTYLKSQATTIGASTGTISNITGTQIWKRSGNLNINGNITLANGPYSSLSTVPRAIIFVDGNVNISSNVTQIDAWIIATGTVNTCSDFVRANASDRGTSANSTCSAQLTFNGPVISSNVVLNRTYGADVTGGQQKYSPGEIFNYRADDYLWAYAQAGRYESSYSETYVRELPPRY